MLHSPPRSVGVRRNQLIFSTMSGTPIPAVFVTMKWTMPWWWCRMLSTTFAKVLPI